MAKSSAVLQPNSDDDESPQVAATVPSSPVLSLQDKVAQAKQAGYSDHDIANYIGNNPAYIDRFANARQAGYSDEEIFGHLGLDVTPKPGLLSTAFQSGVRGAVEAGKDIYGSVTTPFKDETPPSQEGMVPLPPVDKVPPKQDYISHLLEKPITDGWSDPNWWVAHIAHGIGNVAPSMMMGAIGSAAGVALAGGPEDPAAALSGLAGGAGGFALGSAIQELKPAYLKARQDNLDHDAAVDRAMKESGIAAGFGAVMGLAPGVSLFGKTMKGVGAEAEQALKHPISEALAQIFGVQPAIGAAQQEATGAVEGKAPTLGELGTGYAENVGMGLAMTGAHKGLEHMTGKEKPPTPTQPPGSPPGAPPGSPPGVGVRTATVAEAGFDKNLGHIVKDQTTGKPIPDPATGKPMVFTNAAESQAAADKLNEQTKKTTPITPDAEAVQGPTPPSDEAVPTGYYRASGETVHANNEPFHKFETPEDAAEFTSHANRVATLPHNKFAAEYNEVVQDQRPAEDPLAKLYGHELQKRPDLAEQVDPETGLLPAPVPAPAPVTAPQTETVTPVHAPKTEEPVHEPPQASGEQPSAAHEPVAKPVEPAAEPVVEPVGEPVPTAAPVLTPEKPAPKAGEVRKVKWNESPEYEALMEEYTSRDGTKNPMPGPEFSAREEAIKAKYAPKEEAPPAGTPNPAIDRINSSENVHAATRDYLTEAAKDGNEHVVTIDGKTGKAVDATTLGKSGQVDVSDDVRNLLHDPNESLVVHHNHQDGTSHSIEDIGTFGDRPGQAELVVHTPTDVFSVRLSDKIDPKALVDRKRLEFIYDTVQHKLTPLIKKWVENGHLKDEDKEKYLTDLTNRALHAAEITDYESTLEVPSKKLLPQVQNAIRKSAQVARNTAESYGFFGEHKEIKDVHQFTNSVVIDQANAGLSGRNGTVGIEQRANRRLSQASERVPEGGPEKLTRQRKGKGSIETKEPLPEKVNKKSWDYITHTAETDDGMTARNQAQFHYFNPNGVYEKWKAATDEVRRVVDEGKANTGALIAHGSMNDFYIKELKKLREQKKAPSPEEVGRIVNGIKADIAQAHDFVAKADRGEVPHPEKAPEATPGKKANPVDIKTPEDIKIAEQHIETPTQAQIDNDNRYEKGHATFQGMDVQLENAQGGTRSGEGPEGPWETKMPAAYGEIHGTKGADGDKVDIYIGDKNPASKKIFVVDQYDPKTGKFDEHKAIAGVDTAKEAADLYDAGFSDKSGPSRRGDVTEMSVEKFKEWVYDKDRTRGPVGESPHAPKKSYPGGTDSITVGKQVITNHRPEISIHIGNATESENWNWLHSNNVPTEIKISASNPMVVKDGKKTWGTVKASDPVWRSEARYPDGTKKVFLSGLTRQDAIDKATAALKQKLSGEAPTPKTDLSAQGAEAHYTPEELARHTQVLQDLVTKLIGKDKVRFDTTGDKIFWTDDKGVEHEASGSIIRREAEKMAEMHVSLARGLEAAKGTVRHEVIHFLRNIGALDAHWANLKTMAEKDWLNRRWYGAENKSVKEMYSHLDHDSQIEEAIAEAYKHNAAGDRGAWQKITDWFKDLWHKVRGGGDDLYKSLKVFRDINEGKYADYQGTPKGAMDKHGFLKTSSDFFKFWFGDSKIVDKDGNPEGWYHGTARNIGMFQPKQAGAIFLTRHPEFSENFADMSRDWMIDNVREFLTPEQIKEARDKAVKLAGRSGVDRTHIDSNIYSIKEGKRVFDMNDHLKTVLDQMLPSHQNIMKLYVRAENPFDYENPAHVQAVSEKYAPKGSTAQISIARGLENGSWTIIERPEVQAAIKAAGHDSFYVNEGNLKNLAVYSPNQVKSAWGNRGTWSRMDNDIRHNLGEESQYKPVDTESKNFKRWFRQSKVTDENGKPLMVYHGTPNAIDHNFSFDPTKKGFTSFIGIPVETQRHGFFFSEDKSFADSFADQERGKGKGETLPDHLSIENPLYMTSSGVYWKDVINLVDHGVDEKWLLNHAGDPRSTWEAFDDENGKWFVQKLKDAGYDGVFMEEYDPETDSNKHVWVAFHPEQIKSAISNTGEFSPTDSRIRHSLEPEANPHATARDEVLRRGKEDGNEHNAFVDAKGNVTYETSGHENEAHFSEKTKERLRDPSENISVIHNHKSGRTLSIKDFTVLHYPGVSSVAEFGHEGGGSMAALTEKGREFVLKDRDAYSRALDNAYENAFERLSKSGLSDKEAHKAAIDMMGRALDATGILEYHATRDVFDHPQAQYAADLAAWKTLKDAGFNERTWQDVRLTRAGGNREGTGRTSGISEKGSKQGLDAGEGNRENGTVSKAGEKEDGEKEGLDAVHDRLTRTVRSTEGTGSVLDKIKERTERRSGSGEGDIQTGKVAEGGEGKKSGLIPWREPTGTADDGVDSLRRNRLDLTTETEARDEDQHGFTDVDGKLHDTVPDEKLKDPKESFYAQHTSTDNRPLSAEHFKDLAENPGLTATMMHGMDGHESAARLTDGARERIAKEGTGWFSKAMDEASKRIEKALEPLSEKLKDSGEHQAIHDDLLGRSLQAAGLIDYHTNTKIPRGYEMERAAYRGARGAFEALGEDKLRNWADTARDIKGTVSENPMRDVTAARVIKLPAPTKADLLPKDMLAVPTKEAKGPLAKPIKAIEVSNSWLKDSILGRLITNTFFPTLKDQSSRVGASLIREAHGRFDADKFLITNGFKALRDSISKAPKDMQEEFFRACDTGDYSKLPTKQWVDAATALKNMTDVISEKAQKAGVLNTAMEHYFGRYWKQEGKKNSGTESDAEKIIRAIYAKTKLLGPETYNKRRFYDTWQEAREARLEPAFDNPIDGHVAKLIEMERAIMGKTIIDASKATGYVHSFKPGQQPEGWVTLKGKEWERKAVIVDKEGKERFYIPEEKYYAPEGMGNVINNFYSRGLAATPFREANDVWRRSSNLMNQFQLGFSGFHAVATTLEAQISRVSLGIDQVMRGDISKGLKSIAVGASPLNWADTLKKGDMVIKALKDAENASPEMSKIIDALVAAGGRVNMQREERASGSGPIAHSVKGLASGFMQAARQAKLDHPDSRIAQAYTVLSRVMDTAMAPIMDGLVPRQKLGVFYNYAKDWMESHKGYTHDEFTKNMQDIWDTVDNRLGELNYDNIMVNKLVKDCAFIAIRSVGWNVGTLREIGGGVAEGAGFIGNKLTGRDAEWSRRMSYMFALPFVTAMYGALYQLAATGKAPSLDDEDGIRSFFYPRTGFKLPDGSHEHATIPSYMKDVFAYWMQPGQTIENKANPMISTVLDMVNNQDYYGNIIRNPNDPVWQEILDTFGFGMKQFMPFTFTGGEKMQGHPSWEQLASFFGGIQPAPAYISDPKKLELYRQRALKVALGKKAKKEYRDEHPVKLSPDDDSEDEGDDE